LASPYEGNEQEAVRHALHTWGIVERPGLRDYVPSISTYSVVAHLLSLRGELDEAELALERANALKGTLREHQRGACAGTRG
jgi:hypothetical protein